MIYVECKPDAALMQVLTQLPHREIVHEQNKFEVAKKISIKGNARGLVDEDPGSVQPAYLARMEVLRDLPQRGLKMLEDVARGNRVVLLCPKLEDWIIRAAQDAGRDLRDHRYNLPNTPTRLHREITFDLRKFERLVEDLLGTPRLRCLRRLLVQGQSNQL